MGELVVLFQDTEETITVRCHMMTNVLASETELVTADYMNLEKAVFAGPLKL